MGVARLPMEPAQVLEAALVQALATADLDPAILAPDRADKA